MGIGGMSVGSLLIVLAIVVLLFGTKRLRGFGADLGGALSGFRNAMREGQSAKDEALQLEVEAQPAVKLEQAVRERTQA